MARYLFTYAPQQYMIKSCHSFTAHHDKVIFFPLVDNDLFREPFDEFFNYCYSCCFSHFFYIVEDFFSLFC